MEIHLRDVKIIAHHGCNVGEELTGNEFIVNLTVSFELINNTITELDQTVNYAALFHIVSKYMNQRTDLLETIACQIADTIMQNYSIVQTVEISIFKLHPPIPNFEGNVGITHKLYR